MCGTELFRQRKGKPVVRRGRKATGPKWSAELPKGGGLRFISKWNNSSAALKERGFTLIELLVAILLITLVAAVAVPIFLCQREKGWVAQLQAAMRNAATAEELYMAVSGTYTDDEIELRSVGVGVPRRTSHSRAGTGWGRRATVLRVRTRCYPTTTHGSWRASAANWEPLGRDRVLAGSQKVMTTMTTMTTMTRMRTTRMRSTRDDDD